MLLVKKDNGSSLVSFKAHQDNSHSLKHLYILQFLPQDASLTEASDYQKSLLNSQNFTWKGSSLSSTSFQTALEVGGFWSKAEHAHRIMAWAG